MSKPRTQIYLDLDVVYMLLFSCGLSPFEIETNMLSFFYKTIIFL